MATLITPDRTLSPMLRDYSSCVQKLPGDQMIIYEFILQIKLVVHVCIAMSNTFSEFVQSVYFLLFLYFYI